MWLLWCVRWFDTVIISCLAWNIYFNWKIQHSLYHNIDMGNLWHCVLASSTLSESTGLFFGCALFWCWVSLGILQSMVNPSLAPTQPKGFELPTFGYGGEDIHRVLKQYRFSPHGYIFPIVINSFHPWDSSMHHWPRLPRTQVKA